MENSKLTQDIMTASESLDFPSEVGEQIAGLIPKPELDKNDDEIKMNIDMAMELVPELKELYEKDPNSKEIIDAVRKIEDIN